MTRMHYCIQDLMIVEHYHTICILYDSALFFPIPPPLLCVYDHPYCIPTLLLGIHHRPATHIGDISNSRACRQPPFSIGSYRSMQLYNSAHQACDNLVFAPRVYIRTKPCHNLVFAPRVYIHTKPLIIWCLHHGYIT